MPGLITGSRGHFAYTSDDGNTYSTLMSSAKAASGGFSAAAGQPLLPRTYRMRHVRGVIIGSGTSDSAPAVTTLPLQSASFGLYTGSVKAFSVAYPWGVESYSVTGIFGERRPRLASE